MSRPNEADCNTNQGWFSTTLWSQVFSAQTPDDTQGWKALESLCERYWYPLYAFARQSGNNHEDARDLVQGFFEYILSRTFLAQADPNRGRFRSFLLGAFKHYISNQKVKQRAQKRGNGKIHASLEDPGLNEKYLAEADIASNPEYEFDRRWALNLLEGVMKELRSDWQSRGQKEAFERLKPFLLHGPGNGNETYASVASVMGITEAAFKMRVKRLREQYRTILHRTIADTVQDPSEISQELTYLQKCLQG